MAADAEVVENVASLDEKSETTQEVQATEVTSSEPVDQPQQAMHQVTADVLDNYFEQDGELRLQYEVDTPIEKLLELPLVSATNPDMETLVAAVEQCKKLTLDKTKRLVRASVQQQRNTLIIRDLSDDVEYADIKKLLESEQLTSQLSSRVKTIKPELNNNWFVTFSNQDDCIEAALWLNLNGKIKGQKVKCRVKSVLPKSTYTAKFVQQEHMGYENYYNPAYAPWQGYHQNQGYNHYNSNYYPPQPQTQRRQSNRGGRRNNRNNGRGGGRHNNNNKENTSTPKFQRQNSSSSQRRQQRQKPRAKLEASNNNGGDIDYPDEFHLIDRTNFADVIKQAMITEPTPEIPEELKKYPLLKADTVNKFTFDDAPLVEQEAISPYPAPSNPATGITDFSLDMGGETDKNEGKKKERKKEKKKKEKTKAPAMPVEIETSVIAETNTDEKKKIESTVVYTDDQKSEEEEVVLTAAAEENAL